MWDAKFLKIIPALLFLFCLLEIFELGLIINGMNNTEKLEMQLQQNLKTMETIINFLNEHLECMRSEIKPHEKRRCNTL